MKRTTVLVSLLLTATSAVAQEANVRVLLESAHAAAETDPVEAARLAAQAVDLARASKSEAPTAEGLLLQGQTLQEAGDLAGALSRLREAVDLIESVGSPDLAVLQPRALDSLGKALVAVDRDGEAVPVLRRAVDTARAAGDTPVAQSALLSLGWTEFRLGQYDKAAEHALECLRRSESLKDQAREASASLLMGFVRRDMQQRDEALAFFERAERTAREAGDAVLAVRALNEQGNVLQSTGRLAEAVARQIAALAQARRTGDPLAIASSANDLGGAYFRLDRYGEALEHFREAYAINARLGKEREAGLGAANIATVYGAQGRLDEAKAWAEDGLRTVLKTQRPPDEEVARTTLALVLSERGEHAAAFEQLNLAYDLRQEIASDEGARRVADLAALYEADKRQAEIEILTRDRAIKELELDRERGRKRVFLGGLAASGGLAVLLAFGYRSKVRANRAVTRANAELTAARDELDRLSRTDALTGLANRRHVEERLAEEALRFERSGTPFAVVIADLDGFKRVNDQHGHPVGDAVLAHAAGILRSAVRTLDTVGRWGGEEFILLLPMTGIDGACALAEKIRAALAAQEITSGALQLSVTATFGAAAHSGGEVDATIRRADEALYRGKEAGKNRVERG